MKQADTGPQKFNLDVIFLFLFGAGLVASIVQRIWLSVDLSLWLDETWTAVIATQTTWSGFWREAWLDVNPPFYYFVEKLWVSLFGDSNTALRLPSFLALYGAAAVAYFYRPASLSKMSAATWALLIVLWWPGVAISLDARSYALMMLLSTVQLVFLVKVLDQISPARILAWASISSLMVLTHYFAAALVLVQSVALLLAYRGKIFSFWYAAIPFIPTVAWSVYHLPRMLEYAHPDVAWYSNLTISDAIHFGVFTIGPPGLVFSALVGLTFLVLIILQRRSGEGKTASLGREAKNVLLAAILSASALLLLIVIGMIQASMAERYLVPTVPGILLGLVLLANRLGPPKLANIALVSVFLTSLLTFIPMKVNLDARASYGYEQDSRFVRQAAPTELVFLWDHPATKILDERSLDQIGGYFLRRSGNPVDVKVIYLEGAENPNDVLIENATGQRPALLWLYDAGRGSAAADFPPTLASLPDWNCRDLRARDKEGELTYGSISCIKKIDTPAGGS